MNNYIGEHIVTENRVSLSRNISGYNFPHKLFSNAELTEIIQLVDSVLKRIYTHNILLLDTATEFDKQCLKIRNIATDALLANKGTAIITNLQNNLYVFLNELDHIRIISKKQGADVFEQFSIVNALDEEISKNIVYAFDNKYGYLSASPALLGTGLKVYVKFFLIATVRNNEFTRILSVIKKYGLMISNSITSNVVSGFNYVYEITNKTCIGISEDQIIKNVRMAVDEIINIEKDERQNLLYRNTIELQDDIRRAVGILSNAKLLTYEEFVRLNSLLKIASMLSMIKIPLKDLIKLENDVEPVNLCKVLNNFNLTGNNEERANIVRSVILGELK